MRRAVKKQILQLLATLQEAHGEMVMKLQKREYNKVNQILADCQDSAILIGNTIEQFEDTQEEIIKELETYCEQLFLINAAVESGEELHPKGIQKDLNWRIKDIVYKVENIKTVIKAVFFPYKASMWTSLESIWEAAVADEECEAKVVVIPYFSLNSQGKKQELIYEANLFPDNVPIVPYNQYQIEQERPDMVFIHNPYDDMNNVTRVPEQYYSYNLKPYTEQLIYSPYGMMGYYSPKAGAFMCNTKAVYVADKVLVQSKRVKQIYMDHGVDENRLIALGSPKVDKIVEGLKKPKEYPDEWREKLYGRKVFLLNTHLSYFIKGYNYKLKYPERKNYAEHYYELLFEQLLNRDGYGLIWRPHPLLKTMLESRDLYSALEFIEWCEHQIEESENAVIDRNGEYDISFRLSDALVTTYSSMISEYMISGKPIYIYEKRLNAENRKKSPVDYTNNYYMARAGEEPQFPLFMKMILEGEDSLYEARMADVHKAFANLDGTIGQKVYEMLKSEL